MWSHVGNCSMPCSLLMHHTAFASSVLPWDLLMPSNSVNGGVSVFALCPSVRGRPHLCRAHGSVAEALLHVHLPSGLENWIFYLYLAHSGHYCFIYFWLHFSLFRAQFYIYSLWTTSHSTCFFFSTVLWIISIDLCFNLIFLYIALSNMLLDSSTFRFSVVHFQTFHRITLLLEVHFIIHLLFSFKHIDCVSFLFPVSNSNILTTCTSSPNLLFFFSVIRCVVQAI